MERSPEQEEQDSYSQPKLTGFETEDKQEVLLEHVVIDALPNWQQRQGGMEWNCKVYCPPDIFNQERDDCYQAHARSYAKAAKRMSLRPGDVVTLTGIPYTQEIETGNGHKQTVKHFTVSDLANSSLTGACNTLCKNTGLAQSSV